jgi:hypothetical protein
MKRIITILTIVAILVVGSLILAVKTAKKASAVTNFYGQITCANAVATQIIPQGVYGTLYMQNQSAASNVYVCPAAACNNANGLLLTATNATSGLGTITISGWSQPWYCYGSGGNVPLGYYVIE